MYTANREQCTVFKPKAIYFLVLKGFCTTFSAVVYNGVVHAERTRT